MAEDGKNQYDAAGIAFRSSVYYRLTFVPPNGAHFSFFPGTAAALSRIPPSATPSEPAHPPALREPAGGVQPDTLIHHALEVRFIDSSDDEAEEAAHAKQITLSEALAGGNRPDATKQLFPRDPEDRLAEHNAMAVTRMNDIKLLASVDVKGDAPARPSTGDGGADGGGLSSSEEDGPRKTSQNAQPSHKIVGTADDDSPVAHQIENQGKRPKNGADERKELPQERGRVNKPPQPAKCWRVEWDDSRGEPIRRRGLLWYRQNVERLAWGGDSKRPEWQAPLSDIIRVKSGQHTREFEKVRDYGKIKTSIFCFCGTELEDAPGASERSISIMQNDPSGLGREYGISLILLDTKTAWTWNSFLQHLTGAK